MKSINEKSLVLLLKEKGLKVSTAESLTGGMIACKITSVPGASSVIEYGFVTYSDAAKHEVLGVNNETLEKHTAVSKETAREMAIGALNRAGSDIAVAVTGYAGPDGGSEPAGTVYLCAVRRFGAVAKTLDKKLFIDGGREDVRKATAKEAIEALYTLADIK